MREQSIELKVGIFIFIGLTLLFIIVFSIGDIKFFKPYYHIKLSLNFASGIGPTAPVRLCGVSVGEVEGIVVFYDESLNRSRVELTLRIDNGMKIEKDAKATINTLGLLGEKYVEIFPGTKKEFLKEGELLVGHDPITMEEMTEELRNIAKGISVIVDKIKKGEGTIGRLLMEDKIYRDLESITDGINKGEGTLGKLLKDEVVYDNFKDFSEEIKLHPWKLLFRSKQEEAATVQKTKATPKGNKGVLQSK